MSTETKKENAAAEALKSPPVLMSPPVLTPPRQIVPKAKPSPFLSPSLFQKLSIAGSDADSVAASTSGHETTAREEGTNGPSLTTTFALEDGSRERPYRTFIDLERPETSRDFEAHFIVGMTRNKWERPGIHLRKMINMFDMESWTAEIPKVGEFPEVKGRAVLIRRPAFDFIQRKPKLYHKKLQKEDVKKAHQNYVRQEKIQDWVYHLVYMNEGVELENSHFAGEATSIVRTNFNPIKIEGKHENNDFNTDVHLLYAYWEIAFKDGGVKLGDEDEGRVDKKNLFD